MRLEARAEPVHPKSVSEGVFMEIRAAEISAILEEAFRYVAPKGLVAALDAG